VCCADTCFDTKALVGEYLPQRANELRVILDNENVHPGLVSKFREDSHLESNITQY
jgi:hypothetical protein